MRKQFLDSTLKGRVYTFINHTKQNMGEEIVEHKKIVIAAESQRQMNETYTAWIRGRLPKYKRYQVEFIDNLNPSVVIDQSRLGGNARSTVGTTSDLILLEATLTERIDCETIVIIDADKCVIHI